MGGCMISKFHTNTTNCFSFSVEKNKILCILSSAYASVRFHSNFTHFNYTEGMKSPLWK